jgi:hypothetical protein
MVWKNDPEAQYRAGYEEGAWALLKAIESQLPADALRAIEQWTGELDSWRLESRQEVASGKKPAKVSPPALRYPPQSN